MLVGALVAVACDGAVESTDVGACFAEPPRDIDAAETVDCDLGRFQLVAIEQLEGSGLEGWPGDRDLAAKAFDRCDAALESARGSAAFDPDLEVWFDHPREADWESGDRRVVCGVMTLDREPLGGSVLGS